MRHPTIAKEQENETIELNENYITLSLAASSYVATLMACATKHRMAPSHKSMANPPNI